MIVIGKTPKNNATMTKKTNEVILDYSRVPRLVTKGQYHHIVRKTGDDDNHIKDDEGSNALRDLMVLSMPDTQSDFRGYCKKH